LAVIPSILLFVTAIVLWSLRRGREAPLWAVSSAMAGLTWVVCLGLSTSIGSATSLSVWRPEALFDSRLLLSFDSTGWEMAYAAITVYLSLALTQAARPGTTTMGTRIILPVYAGIGVAAMLAGNLLTVAITWAMLDLLTFVFLMSATTDEKAIPGIITRLAMDGFSVVIVLAAAAASWATGQANTAFGEISTPLSAGLIAFAGLIRLGMFPLHFSLPKVPRARRGLGTMIRLLPPAIVLAVLARQFEAGFPVGLVPWLTLASAIGAVVGGLRWAFAEDPVQGRPFFILAIASTGVLAAGMDPSMAGVILANTGALILLVGSAFSLAEIHSPSHRIWPIAAAMLVVGAPFTLSGVIAGALATGFVSVGTAWLAILGAIGLAALGIGVVSGATAPQTNWPIGESMVRVVYGLGIALPVLVAIGMGFQMASARSLAGGVFFAGVVLAALLGRVALRRLPYRYKELGMRAAARLDPASLYRGAWRAYVGVLGFVRALAQPLEGEGGMLWMLVVVILVILGVRGAGP
jgi:hypothetical protein